MAQGAPGADVRHELWIEIAHVVQEVYSVLGVQRPCPIKLNTSEQVVFGGEHGLQGVLPGDSAILSNPTGKSRSAFQQSISTRAIVSPLYGVFTPQSYALDVTFEAL